MSPIKGRLFWLHSTRWDGWSGGSRFVRFFAERLRDTLMREGWLGGMPLHLPLWRNDIWKKSIQRLGHQFSSINGTRALSLSLPPFYVYLYHYSSLNRKNAYCRSTLAAKRDSEKHLNLPPRRTYSRRKPAKKSWRVVGTSAKLSRGVVKRRWRSWTDSTLRICCR